jgi:curved DNA-binding protein CbpA
MSLYKDLGIKENATPEEIKKAYKKRINETHPDKGGDEEEFLKVKSSYLILKDEFKRKSYDGLGEIIEGESDAETILRQGFNELVGKGLFENDILAMLRAKITGQFDNAENGIQDNERFIGLLEKQLGRFEVKDGESIYESVIKQHIRKSKLNVSNFELILKQCKDVRELINDYRDIGSVEE